MSLDDVELMMMLEDDFGIEITDEEAQEVLTDGTVGRLYDYVVEKTQGRPRPSPPTVCVSSNVFYRVRRGLMEVCGAARTSVRPATPTESLLPAAERREQWQALQAAIGLRLPALRRPAGLGLALALLLTAGLATGLVLTVLIWALAIAWWDGAGSVLAAGCFVAPVAGLAWGSVLAHRRFRAMAVCVPVGCATLRGLVQTAMRENGLPEGRRPGGGQSDEVWQTIVKHICSVVGATPDQITRDSHLYRDLGLG